MVMAVRLALVFAMAAAMALTIVALRKLAGTTVALLAAILIILDPFTTGSSRMLHVDGLAASFSLLALIQALLYIAAGRRLLDLIVSGIALGLACLARMSMLALVLVVGFLALAAIMLDWRRTDVSPHNGVAKTIRDFAIWGGVIVLTIFLLWPALWVDPGGVVATVVA
jgi:4-amino-4-deoxy-L-arabinose transferase-like glycosyltransferase